MSEAFVLLTKLNSVTEAETVAGFLRSNHIECFIPDENVNRMLFHMSPALGHVRLQVRKGDLERAKLLLKEQNLSLVSDDHEATIVDLKADSAKRAAYAACFGLVFLPVVFNLYSFYFMYKYYRSDLPATKEAKRRIYLAWFFNIFTVVCYSLLFSKYVQEQIQSVFHLLSELATNPNQ